MDEGIEMTGDARDAIRRVLDSERTETTRLIEQLSARLAAVIEATADSSSDDEHDPEGSTLAVERGQLVAQLERSRVRLDELDAALSRADAGTYGRCERCGEPISDARLEALPAARLCIGCASRGSTRRW
ncbi:TraR/DksA C4-type zinc finger protein [Gordonia sp. Z-3]|uniref:TraR/DksA C4-type zinc finger protein n=3 Tax=Gordoniaceae TaxID=85026 RepID=A0A9X3D0T6_9ACTN|nr:MULTISPECIES: TraR/DksA C4-type zinc finger protein [Gordonia]MCF3940753.1 TraR/DksA C4-type zinc finger protein [Gordonia tangerina]MCX2962825.1 TraR/DksA C4-type zinc finger protein [Gordonia aquimaris]MED5799964.1 TraR/DksA C4-type zinc finger protein [Gordonia sp. Z-3]